VALHRAKLSVGDVHEADLVRNLTRTQIVQYAGASGDYNPVHIDEVFATKVAGYPTVFAHGMLTMGLTGRMLTDYVGDGRLTYYGARFVGQVWPGDDLVATATVEALREEGSQHFVDLAIATRNQNGEEVLRAHATARIDP
jgi:acyl dehydratase